MAAALTPATVTLYWQRLLERYRALQRFAPAVPHPDAVPLSRAVLLPDLRNATQRTCPVCRQLPWPDGWPAGGGGGRGEEGELDVLPLRRLP